MGSRDVDEQGGAFKPDDLVSVSETKQRTSYSPVVLIDSNSGLACHG